MSINHRDNLSRIAANITYALDDVDNGYVSIPVADAAIIVASLERYLSGDAKSLDLAFGVARGKGAPKRGPSQRILRRASRAMFRGNKSWLDVAVEEGTDPRTLQREVARHAEFVLRDFADRLATRMKEKKREK